MNTQSIDNLKIVSQKLRNSHTSIVMSLMKGKFLLNLMVKYSNRVFKAKKIPSFGLDSLTKENIFMILSINKLDKLLLSSLQTTIMFLFEEYILKPNVRQHPINTTVYYLDSKYHFRSINSNLTRITDRSIKK